MDRFYAYNFPEGFDEGRTFTELPVSPDGLLDCHNRDLCGWLVTNALLVDCRNNALEWVDAPHAQEVNCACNAIETLRLAKARRVDCSHNPAMRRLCLPCAVEVHANKCPLKRLDATHLPAVRILCAAYSALEEVYLPTCGFAWLEYGKIRMVDLPSCQDANLSFNAPDCVGRFAKGAIVAFDYEDRLLRNF